MEGFHSEEVPQHDQHLPKPLARLLQIHPRSLSHCRNGIGGRLQALPKIPFLQENTAELGQGAVWPRSQALSKAQPGLGPAEPGRRSQLGPRGITGCGRGSGNTENVDKEKRAAAGSPQALPQPLS